MIEEERTLPFQGLAEVYSNDFYKNQSRIRANHLLSVLSIENIKSSVAVDLGCGNGLVSDIISVGMNSRVVGVDISASMLGYSREYLIKNSNLNFINMNITKLGFKNETFDLAYSLFDVLNYLNTEDFNKFLNDLKYITKNKGFIALDFLTPLAFYDTDKNPDSIQIGEDFYYISKTNKISEELVNLDLTAFIKYRDDLYKKISEHHKLNLLNTTRIIKKLKDKDFTVKNVYDGEEIKEADENSWHVIIIAQNNA